MSASPIQAVRSLGRNLRGINYLKLGCGVMVGVEPSIIPLSLTVRTPPGSSKAFKRSKTEGLQREFKWWTGQQATLTLFSLQKSPTAPDLCLLSAQIIPLYRIVISFNIFFPINPPLHFQGTQSRDLYAVKSQIAEYILKNKKNDSKFPEP